jgi:MFS family permease
MFGLVLGMQESIYRAAVCELVPLRRRGTAYGIFNAILGFGTLVSGVIFGYFLNAGYSMIILVGFSLTLQIGSILTLMRNRKLFSNASLKQC